MRSSSILIYLSFLLVATACKQEATDSNESSPSSSGPEITGAISYRDSQSLPPDAMITVQLVDLHADGTVITETSFETAGNTIPFFFSLPYEADNIAADGKYGLTATIKYVSNILYHSPQPVEVLTNGREKDVTLMLATGPPPRQQVQ